MTITTNPYAAPITEAVAEEVRQRAPWSRSRLIVLGFALLAAQVGGTAVTVHWVHRDWMIPGLRTGHVHVLITSMVLLLTTILMARRNRLPATVLFSQVMNAVMWPTMVTMIATLEMVGFSEVSLQPQDVEIVAIIWFCNALLLGTASVIASAVVRKAAK